MSGKSKGMRGEVKQVLRNRNMVLVSGVNLVKVSFCFFVSDFQNFLSLCFFSFKKHQPGTGEVKGGIYTKEAPIHVSTVSLIDPVDDKPCRVRWVWKQNKDGEPEKVRQSVRTGGVIEKNDLVIKERRRATEDGPYDT